MVKSCDGVDEALLRGREVGPNRPRLPPVMVLPAALNQR